MSVFEVFIPARDAGAPNVTLTIEGRNWIEALRSGLKSIGEGGEAIANVMCDVKEDGSIHVTDVATRRVFRLREQKSAAPAVQPAAAAAQPPPPAEKPRPITVPEAPAPPGTGDAFAPAPKTMLQFPAFKAEPAATPPQSFAHEETERMPVPPPAPTAAPAPALPRAPTPPATVLAPPATVLAPPATVLAPPATAQAKLPELDQSVPWTKMPGPERTVTPGPFARATPAQGVAAPRPATGAQQIVTQAVVDNDTAKIPAFRNTTDETERVERSPRSVPSAPPTPRGVRAPAPRRPSGQFAAAPAPQVREESRPLPTDPKIGRVVTAPVDVTDAIAAVFDATQDLYLEQRLSPEKVAAKLLDIALAHIPAESGSFYLADVNGHELSFAAVRGPKADQLKRSGMTVPLGQGIIGFCALEGICLSVSDIQKDPRWLSSIGKKLDYLPKDTLCASAEKDGRLFGAVQLINSKAGFDAAHMEVLRFIGLTAAALLERIEAAS